MLDHEMTSAGPFAEGGEGKHKKKERKKERTRRYLVAASEGELPSAVFVVVGLCFKPTPTPMPTPATASVRSAVRPAAIHNSLLGMPHAVARGIRGIGAGGATWSYR